MAFTGDRIVAAPGLDNAVDRWDLTEGTPRLTSRPCGCEAVAPATVLDPAGRFAAIGTLTGKIVLWDVDEGRTQAEQTLITEADQEARPHAVVDDRFVLYSLQSTLGGAARPDGPLTVWDTHDRTTTELWTCPDGCDVRTVTRLPGTNRLLVYAAKPGGDDPSLWTATLRHA